MLKESVNIFFLGEKNVKTASIRVINDFYKVDIKVNLFLIAMIEIANELQ